MAGTAVLILAAGRGTRMHSNRPKVLHEAGGRSLLGSVLAAVKNAGVPAADTAVVAGFAADAVQAQVDPLQIRVIVQEPQLGTGHAVRVSWDWLARYTQVVVLNGDMPLLSAGTVQGLMSRQEELRAAAILATASPREPRAYGRILRDPDRPERIVAILEERQASAEQKQITELNAGFYCFAVSELGKALAKLGTDNPHREYYLTDTIAFLAKSGYLVTAWELRDELECLGVNDQAELAQLDRCMRQRKTQRMLAAGVSIQSPETVTIDADVEIGSDTVLESGVQLLGNTRIGSECRVRSYSILQDCEVGNGVVVKPHCVLESAQISAGAIVGPFTRLREGAQIGPQAHIGNFVEVKKSKVGAGTKANHLAYLGDAEIGEKVNIGAGTITCNYDGRQKHPTRIGDGSFVGSNSTLVAPLDIGSDAYVGAGSVITEQIPTGALGLGRSRQVNKPGWSAKRRVASQSTAPRSKDS